MGLQVVRLHNPGREDAYLAVGGFDYKTRTCSSRISWVDQVSGEEVVLPISLKIGRNHFLTYAPNNYQFLAIGGYDEQLGTLNDIEFIDWRAKTVETWPKLKAPVELATLAEFIPDTTLREGQWIYGGELIKGVAIIGGLTAQGETKTHEEIQIIDLKTHQVSLAKSHLAESRFGHATVRVGQKVYVIGGKHVSRENGKAVYKSISSIECWDMATDTITTIAHMKSARDRPGVVVFPGGIEIFGGADENGQLLNSIELLNPETAQVRDFGHMKVARMAPLIREDAYGAHVMGGWAKTADDSREVEYLPQLPKGSEATEQPVLPAGWLTHSRAEGAIADKVILGGKDMFQGRNPHSYSFTISEVLGL